MDTLKKEIKTIKNTLNAFENGLVMCHDRIKDGKRSDEYIELRLSVIENHEARLSRVEAYLNVLHKHLNETISRVNDIHTYLWKRDQCEEMESSDEEKNNIPWRDKNACKKFIS